jgi:hypothetical protein
MSVFKQILSAFGLKKDHSHVVVPPLEMRREMLSRLRRFHEMLIADEEKNFSTTVERSASLLALSLEEDARAKEFFAKSRLAFNGMWGGMGSLNDFYLIHGPEEDLKERRDDFERLGDELRHFFRHPL